MRLLAPIVLSALFFAPHGSSVAADRWMYNDSANATETAAMANEAVPPPLVHDPPASVPAESSWFPKPSWPAVNMPELSRPRLPRPQFLPSEPSAGPSRNSWYVPPAESRRSSPWQAMKGGAHRVGQGTRAAWSKTVDVLTPWSNRESRHVAHRQPKPPLWKRALGIAEEEPQGPRTVTEWMAQERLNP
jgi:hypothetical protein